MPRIEAPEVVTGAREPRTAESVTMVRGPEEYPQVRDRGVEPESLEQAHFVSRFREYAVVVATEPDHVTAAGQIVKGVNLSVRFKDFQLITSDSRVIKKLRSMREYGLGRELWEKHQQDRDLAEKALSTAEAAIDGLPQDLQDQLLGRLAARFATFQLPKREKGVKNEKTEKGKGEKSEREKSES